MEIGEMDGRNAGSAVIGFVNGMCIIKIHSPHFSENCSLLYKSHHSLSRSYTHRSETKKTYIDR